MTDLNRLSVSLTKHGAHKIATLLKMYDKDHVLDHTWGNVGDVRIDRAQAKKNLSASTTGRVPDVWGKVKVLGDPAIDALVLIGIIASHNTIMEALIAAREPVAGTGTIKRGLVLEGKEFTNVAHTIEQLGFCTDHKVDYFRYDFSRLFTIPNLHELAAELLALKLRKAGWDQNTKLVDELIACKFHDIFSLSESSFRSWIGTGSFTTSEVQDLVEDIGFFSAEDDENPSKPFKFIAGHTPKKTGVIDISPQRIAGKAKLLHNEIQTQLYSELKKKYGASCVGTEVPSGHGATSIDLVVNTKDFCWFYEIKTSSSVKSCIRQAIPQLLEYAYWDGDKSRCDRLMIVGPKPITNAANQYLTFLRDSFKIELYYLECKLE